jgi:hypothetical protein
VAQRRADLRESAGRLRLLEQHGQFGTRLKGGVDKNAGSPRYIKVRPEKWLREVFRPEDDALLLRAYQLRINITRKSERDALKTHGNTCDLVKLYREVRSELLAGLVGSELLAEVLPGARFEAPGERP